MQSFHLCELINIKATSTVVAMRAVAPAQRQTILDL
jgi:hypothetical protein